MALTIIQWNIKGYLNNYNNLQILIKKYQPKIIALQEIHTANKQILPVPINYSIYQSTKLNSFGGSAILIHKSIQHIPHNDNQHLESISATITSKIKFTITSIYISPNLNFEENDLVSTFNIDSLPKLILGDFNSWHRNWGSPKGNKRGKIINDYIEKSNFIILNNGSPTHFTTHNTFTHIDLTICSSILAPATKWKISDDLYNSDHFPIIITMFDYNSNLYHNSTFRFKLNEANWEKYQRIANRLNSYYEESTNTNRESKNIRKIILKSANESIPQNAAKIRKFSVPWWDKELENLKLNKKKFWNKLKNNLTIENLLNYKKTNSLLKRKLKLKKQLALQEFTTKINPNTPTKEIWNNIRILCGMKTYKGIHAIAKPNSNSEFITNKSEIAEEICQYWSEQSKDYNFSIAFQSEKNKIKNFCSQLEHSDSAKKIEEDITTMELCIALNSLKGQTPGIDKISYSMIKHLPQSVKTRLIKLYNSVLNNDIPDYFKVSLVLPILKPTSDKSDINSYRPISLNSCCAKTLDKIIANRLWWYLEKNKLIDQRQVGFRRGKSIDDILIQLEYLSCKALSLKKHISIVSLDFAKAYDKIGIHTIINQMRNWNLGPKICNYVINFMKNRKIQVRVDQHLSHIKPLNNGIPQGSPLSVVLFLIGYCKLTEIITRHKEIQYLAYADDFYIIKTLNKKDKNKNLDITQLDQHIKEWCNYSGAILSTTKCKHLHICRKKNCIVNAKVGNSTIKSTEEMRILGVYFNRRLTWTNHIEKLCSSLSQSLNIIKCLSNTKFNCSPTTLTSVTEAILGSKIDYGLYLFGYSSKTYLNKIKTIYNSAIRHSLNAFRTSPINSLMLESNMKTIETRIEISTLKLIKKIIFSNDSNIAKMINYIKKTKNKGKVIPALTRCIKQAEILGLPSTPIKSQKNVQRQWDFKPNIIDSSLRSMPKQNTNISIYKIKFCELKEKYRDYNFIYTDGSKNNSKGAYAITTETETIEIHATPEFSTIFSIEIIAIYNAILHFIHKVGKFAICSDSLSAIDAIQNTSNEFYPNSIRQLLIKNQPKFIIIWIPGHSNIKGNETADKAAKNALDQPIVTTPNYNYNDIKKFIQSEALKKQLLRLKDKPNFYINNNTSDSNYMSYLKSNNAYQTPKNIIAKIIRLRIGHTKITHKHLLNPTESKLCHFCDNRDTISVEHLLLHCCSFTKVRKEIFRNSNPIESLFNPNLENTEKIVKYLKLTKLIHLI